MTDLPAIAIVIPTRNREHCIAKAVNAALNQSYANITVTVVDDCSEDNTRGVLEPFFSHPRFNYIRLGSPVGSAQAKNVGLLCTSFDAVTFHNSEDIPEQDKILFQFNAMFSEKKYVADHTLNWKECGHLPGCEVPVDVVVGTYRHMRTDGSVYVAERVLSLLNDFFPNLQFPPQSGAEWVIFNSAMFRKKIFEEIGGYMNCAEDEREMKNRTIGCGYVYYFLKEALLTKVDSDGAISSPEDGKARAGLTEAHRQDLWNRLALFKHSGSVTDTRRKSKVTIDIPELQIEWVSNGGALAVNKLIPVTSRTLERLETGILVK